MNIRLIACSAALLGLFATGSALAFTDEEIDSQCRQYATEDGVPAEEMDDYLAECAQSLLAGAPEDDTETAPISDE